jgi:hypothetical protein
MCLVSGRTDSITRQSLSALLTLPAVGHAEPGELGFSKVMRPANALRVEVLQQEHRTRRVVRLSEREHLAQPHNIALVVGSQDLF